ncbi:MAG TPA: PilZ domain-containing protein [Terriglobales bacterium]|nr:PilZ domain-containing protein [Terriglobales bacterium]
MATPTRLIDKALASAAAVPSSRRNSARVALINVKDSARIVLSECFRQFGIETVLMTDCAAERLKKEKFEACVLRLDENAEVIMESARTSRSNSRMVIYGLGGSAQEAMRFSKYGINAIFNEPLERPAALKLVRATQTLVLHEFRRYVRIPVMTEIALTTIENRRLTATSHELSAGGMSMRSEEDISPGTAVEISFALLTLPRIWVRGTVSWRKPDKSFGVRFDPQDERRVRIKEWIEAYLEN